MSNGNANVICLNERQMLLSGSKVEMVVLGYLVPVFILFGFTGNLINLTVLMAKGMKTRSNTLLATLAMADMAFLLFMLPHSMAHYKWLAFNNLFRQFYFTSKMHLIAFLNWSSAATIWLVLTICIERLVGIRYPLSVRKHRAKYTHLLILGIVLFTGLLTSYNHFSYDCIIKSFCHNTQIHSFCFPVDSDLWPKNISNTHSTLIRYYVRWSQPINAVAVVFLPTFVVVLSNVLLIHTLRQRKKLLLYYTHEILLNTTLPSNLVGKDSLQGKLAQRQMRVEHKVTFTVCAIVTCFTITQAPSAIVTLATGFIEIDISKYQMHLITVTTFMIVVGKSLNFVLFCLSSATFRQRFMAIMKARFNKNYAHRLMKESSSNSFKSKPATCSGRVQKRRIQAIYLGAIGQADGLVHSSLKPSTSNQSCALITANSIQQKSSSELRMANEMAASNSLLTSKLSTSQTQSKPCTNSEQELEVEETSDLPDSNHAKHLLEQLPLLTSRPILHPLPPQFDVSKTDSNKLLLNIPTPLKELSSIFEKSDQCSVARVNVFNDLTGKDNTARCAKISAYITAESIIKNQAVGTVVWELLLNSPVTLLQANSHWTVAVCEVRTLHIFQTSCGKAQRVLQMDAPICILHLQEDICLAIDSNFNLFTWNLKTSSLVVEKSLAVLANSESRIIHQSVSPAGIPLVIISNGNTFVYSKEMDIWLTLNTGYANLLRRVVDQMKLISSSVPNGLIAMICKYLPKTEDKLIFNKQVNEAGEELQLETLIQACIALQSPFEMRFLFNIYVQKLARRGKWEKLVECIQELQSNSIEGVDISAKIIEDVENILQTHGTTLNQLLVSKENVDLSFMD